MSLPHASRRGYGMASPPLVAATPTSNVGYTASSSSYTLTTTGQILPVVDSPFASGQATSGQFDGSSWIQMNNIFEETSASFTMEVWFKWVSSLGALSSNPFGSANVIGGNRINNSQYPNINVNFQIESVSYPRTRTQVSTNASSWTTTGFGSSVSAVDTWYHYALVRNGTSIQVYKNGVAEQSTTLSGNFTINYNFFMLGASGFDTSRWRGNMSNFRYSTVARYTSNFTAPTAPFTWDSNTKLLIPFNEPITQFNGVRQIH